MSQNVYNSTTPPSMSQSKCSRSANTKDSPDCAAAESERRFTFKKTLNLFGLSTSSSSTIAKKIERRDSGDNECKADIKGLKQFWNSHILNVQNATVKQKSSTLQSYRSTTNASSSEKSRTLEHCGRFNSVPSLSVVNDNRTADNESEQRNSFSDLTVDKVDNFDKFKTAETVKIRRASKEDLTFPLVVTTGGTKIHWAKRDDIFKNASMPKSMESKFKIEASPSKDSVMVSDMVDMVMEQPSTPAKTSRKVSFRTKAAPTNSYHRRIKADGSSRVAVLTHRFNQLIQKDDAVLTEIKKNGSFVHKVGNHVYKVMEEAAVKKKDEDASSVSSRVSSTKKKSSVRRKASIKTSRHKEKSVRDLKDLFEPSPDTQITKPKVPDKSETVLQRSSELRIIKKFPEATVALDFSEPLKPKEHFIKNDSDRSKYSRMYEKLKIRSLFAANRKQSKDESPDIPHCEEKHEEVPYEKNESSFIYSINISGQDDFDSRNDDELISEYRLLEAITTIDSRIESLTKNRQDDDMKPNQSFLFSTLPKSTSTCDVQSSLVVAINEALNKTQSMDESLFPHDSGSNKLLSTIRVAQDSNEAINESAGYEYIRKPDTEEVYQTLAEAYTEKPKRDSVNSYESFEQYESLPEYTGKDKEYGYEICEPPPEPPPPRKPSAEPLPLPTPKRNLTYPGSTYECNEGGPPPPRPSKNHLELPLPPRNATDQNTNQHQDQDDEEVGHDYDEENIYDTIKNGDNQSLLSSCYEVIQQRNKLNGENLIYESLIAKTEYQRYNGLQHADSILTLASDQKTNSIYDATIGPRNSLPSERGSDASDEWVDISSDEEEEQKFIVIREIQKTHRSPDWSRKVRGQHNHQRQISSDDNDHHYESLCPLEQARRKLNEKFDPKQLLPVHVAKNDDHHHHHHHHHHGDDSFDDSFESDCESDGEKKVDITNAKLPDPPQQPKQVYALMQKIRTFGSISKQEISKSFNKIRKKSATSSPKIEKVPLPGQPYENTTFYVNTAMKQDERPTKSKKPTRRLTTSAIEFPYENHDFHTPRISSPVLNATPQVSSPSINDEPSSPTEAPELLSRKKSKSGRSFKSKLRKSFATESSLSIGSSVYGSSSRSTFYISDSVDVDSGIFAGDNTKLGASQELEKPNLDRKSTTPDYRRRSVSARPNNPPPPPPPDRQPKKNTTSWYAECGVFKSEAINGNKLKTEKGNTTSWYTEAGLYQTSGESVISSSGSSGVSTGGEGGPGDDNMHSMFLNEPLYQIYNANRLESISRDIATDSDGYEEVGGGGSGSGGGQTPSAEKKPQRPTALQLVEPNKGSNRTLWSEVSEVISSGILGSLSAMERYLQEAKFEILTSEASYLKSLNLLKTHFMNHPAFRDNQILSSADRKTLFSYIIPVQECSDRLLSDLESCWQDNIMLIGLSESLMKNAEKYFHVYIAYCEHQGKLDRTLKRLKEAKGVFSQTLETLESDPVCCGLTIHSFLMLPMQRITRFPLLIDTVLNKLKDDDDEKQSWSKVMHLIRKIASQCNEAANRCEQKFIMQQISQQIEFPSTIRPLPIVPVGIPVPGTPIRTLVKKGEMTHLVWRDEGKLTFGRKFVKTSIYAFLFTDLLILTKKRGDDSYLVFDHCARSMVTVSSGDVIPQLPTKEVATVGKHLILMTLFENYEGKTFELILACPSETERERWLQATEPPCSENPDEKLYEQWDCPQVVAKHRYEALQPDELSLEVGDIINVFRKMVDGWYHGERVCDCAQGWFPGNFTEEMNTQHVRARTLKERYRFLTQSGNYVQTTIATRKK